MNRALTPAFTQRQCDILTHALEFTLDLTHIKLVALGSLLAERGLLDLREWKSREDAIRDREHLPALREPGPHMGPNDISYRQAMQILLDDPGR
jgi:hypothetical protein